MRPAGGGGARRMSPGVPDTSDQPPRSNNKNYTKAKPIFQVTKGFRNKMPGTTTKAPFKVYIYAGKLFITVQ